MQKVALFCITSVLCGYVETLYVFKVSSVYPEIVAAPGLGRLVYYWLQYFPLRSVLQTALSDIRMQPLGIS